MSKSLDGVITKKANQKETFSEDQINDLMQCMNTDDGYLYFAKQFAFVWHWGPASANQRKKFALVLHWFALVAVQCKPVQNAGALFLHWFALAELILH